MIPLIGGDVRLIKDTVQCADGDFGLLGDDCGIYGLIRLPHELYVASLLTGFYEACLFKTALDLPEG